LVLHVDMDQFIAAVEQLRRPELRGKPVVVGGDGDPAKRGVVSTASYEARAFGVDTDDPESFARGVAADVKAATDLDCSVGIGDNKLQAKIATSFGKPAGIGRLTTATWFPTLGDQPPDAIWGIGAKTTAKLAALGIATVRQLADADPRRLATEFGPTTGPWLVLLGNGRGEREVDPTPYVPRSHGREVTFQRNLTDWAEIAAEVSRLARQVAAEVTDRPVARVVVKVRYAPFITITHGTTLPPDVRWPPGLPRPDMEPLPLDDGKPTAGSWAVVLEQAAAAALAQFTPGRAVRLLGVRAEFADKPG